MRVALITALALGVVIFAGYKWWDKYHELPPIKNVGPFLPGGSASSVAAPRKSLVVIQTGPERLTNAFRCLVFTLELANTVPQNLKVHIRAQAGITYMQDYLMSKMSHGYIVVTTNELRQSFSNALAQIFTNQVPREIMEEFNAYNKMDLGRAMLRHGDLADQYPEVAVIDGFNYALSSRNNIQYETLDSHYEAMAKYPELATPIRTMASAFQQAGITDADSSDLLGLCLGMAEGRTTAYLMYGPQSAASLGKEMAQSGAPPEAVAIAVKNQTASDTTEYQAYAGALDTVLRWRLTNMYGLDDASAQALVQSVSRVPVTAFSSAGVQVPAYLQ